MGKQDVDCFACSHFYITWDKGFPYGCRAMGFKARNVPSDEVYKASGKNCLGFSPKDGRLRTRDR